MKTTCQICGREIKAKTGVIAHHGYTRPQRGSGWQTSSCFGARWRPYEVACDALPPAITRASNILERTTASIAKLRDDPPATLTIIRKDAWGSTRQSTTVSRPEGFIGQERPGSYRPNSYEGEYWHTRSQLDFTEKNIQADLKYMDKRLADWRAPQ